MFKETGWNRTLKTKFSEWVHEMKTSSYLIKTIFSKSFTFLQNGFPKRSSFGYFNHFIEALFNIK